MMEENGKKALSCGCSLSGFCPWGSTSTPLLDKKKINNVLFT